MKVKMKITKHKKVLVIDNIDSFVYNLVQYVGMLGGNPIVLQNTVGIDEVRENIKKDSISHIIISPGPKTPKDAGVSNQIIKEFSSEIPILGVCLGHQCIGHVYGAVIRQAKTLKHGKTSLIEHNGIDIFEGISNPLEATRYHSLVIDEETLPDCLKVTARSRDDNEIMGLKHKEYQVYGLQFHPESILTNEGMKIMENFLGLK
ncbi:MAG: aminodeoxychorismate/anthranilate synthase component II [Candidatus Altiarchaeota archaeon]|nr:aminodeoxychorismate/anthranilate synthase component II [Candidatus Altiarchaeota archaeon]